MEITKEDKKMLDEILFDWYDLFNIRNKKGEYKTCYKDLLEFIQDFLKRKA